MAHPSRQIRYFLFGQHLADGIRITLEILAPAVVFAWLSNIETGIVLSLGALAVSISDAPGPVLHKRNGMFYCLVSIFLMSLLTGYLNHNSVLLGLLIMVATFFFSMFNVYGSRAASIGSAALLIMALNMSRLHAPSEVILQSLLVLAGGAWYMMAAMIFYILTPFRPIQRSLGDCLTETARYLEIRSELYKTSINTDETFRKLLDQQMVVSNKQDVVRELLFKNRAILKESTHQGRLLVITFAASVDLFEQTMATGYEYHALRKKYGPTGILEMISHIIRKLAIELNRIGEAIHSQTQYANECELLPQLDEFKKETERITDAPADFTTRKIIINLRSLGTGIDSITDYFGHHKSQTGTIPRRDYSKFVTHQKINGRVLKNNLTMESSAFRHALRVMITCVTGYILATLFFSGQHSYWIIMTIIIILKPAYSLTKSKNFDRLTGTIGGGFVGLLLLAFISNDFILFGFLIFFMLGTYTFVRRNYIVMVVFLTPYVLILFHFLRMDFVHVAGERLIDTVIASVLAYLASNFLFPSWESKSMRNYLTRILKANSDYLNILWNLSFQKPVTTLDYKLIRKEVFVSTANLSAALHRMLSEPESKQSHKKEVYQFVVLNHVLSSNIAGLTENWMVQLPGFSRKQSNLIKTGLDNLRESMVLLEKAFADAEPEENAPGSVVKNTGAFAIEQLEFIKKISKDILRLTTRIAA